MMITVATELIITDGNIFFDSTRVTGEEWLVNEPGAYLRGVWEQVC